MPRRTEIATASVVLAIILLAIGAYQGDDNDTGYFLIASLIAIAAALVVYWVILPRISRPGTRQPGPRHSFRRLTTGVLARVPAGARGSDGRSRAGRTPAAVGGRKDERSAGTRCAPAARSPDYAIGLVARPLRCHFRLGPDSLFAIALFAVGIAGLFVLPH